MSAVFASAADERYGYHLLNLIGSLKANSDVFDSVVAFDLGLSPHQRGLLGRIPGVEVREVPPFAPHWAQGFTWKPWAWTQLEGDAVFWLDAGATLLRSLAPALEQIRERDYFLVSQGNRLDDIVPPDYFDLYGIPPSLAGHPYVAAGILGYRPGGEFQERVLLPTFEDCLAGRSLGFSADEAERLNHGLGRIENPPIRSVAHFRWDQTVLNARLFSTSPDAAIAELDEYAGWRSPRDHPRQVIWSHRARGSMAYLRRIPYAGPGARRARAWGAGYRLRWWLKLNERFLDPTTYQLKARRLLRRR